MADSSRVIGTCALVTLGVGSLNSIAKNKTLPSSRFLIGTGVAFFILSALAEAEPEVAKALSLAVVTTVVIGQGDGALSYLNHRGEIDTQQSKSGHPKQPPTSTDYGHTLPKQIPHPTSLPPLTPYPAL